MSDFIFNVAKGKVRYYLELPAANDSILIVPLEAAGLEADATMKDKANLAAVLAASTNEQVTMGRLTVAPSITQDDTLDQVLLKAANGVWATPTGNDIGALLFCYKPDTASVDSAIIPLSKHDFFADVGVGSITVATVTDGFVRIQ